MNLFRDYWRKVCEPLDGFLWHKDISHPIIRPLLRNEILASGALLLAGAICFAVFPWLFWMGIGLLIMLWIFWSWARFFLRAPLDNFSMAFLRSVLVRFALRLALVAMSLYVCLAYFRAPVSAILAGLIAGSVLALISYARALRAQ